MRINSVNNIAFGATLRGDIDKIKRIAIAGGLSKDRVDTALDYIHQLLPNHKDKVYLYFKKYVNEDKDKESIIRSGIKIVKNDIVYEKNLDPTKILQKNLLYKFVSEVKKLLFGITNPDDCLKTLQVPRNSWIDKFDDKETKLLAFTPRF